MFKNTLVELMEDVGGDGLVYIRVGQVQPEGMLYGLDICLSALLREVGSLRMAKSFEDDVDIAKLVIRRIDT